MAIEVVTGNGFGVQAAQRIGEVARSHLVRVDELSERLIRGLLPVF